MLYFFSNGFILHEAMRLWETDSVKKSQIRVPYDYGIVMGGVISYDSDFEHLNFAKSADRLMQAFELYRDGKVKKLVLSSGTGSLKNSTIPEASVMKKYLEKLGVPGKDILAENASRNTFENAVYTSRLLKSKKSRNLLITSSYHMRRSLACFRKTGLAVDPYIVDRHSIPRKFYPDHLFIPSPTALEGWNVLLHEMTGFLLYRLNGYAE